MRIDQLHTLDEERLEPDLEAFPAGAALSYESTLRTRTGRLAPVQVYARTVRIDDIQHVQWILRDISERKNLDSLREDLISMIYHDLRSPLANVISSLDVFESMLPEDSDPAFHSLLQIAIRSTERIQRLTHSLLDINRLEAGQPIGELFATAAALLIGDAIEAVEPTAANKGILLEVSVPPDLPPVLVDADMIRRVLSNLLENAVRFTPPGGIVQAGAAQEGKQLIQFWVQDSGPGIPAADRERIFDKYTRLNDTNAARGFGLGLAYCRLAIEGHGGRIWEAGRPGEGARFCFTLPQVNRSMDETD
jgi:signal transduction histidine kinase